MTESTDGTDNIDDTLESESATKINYKEAANAAIAQSIANAAQDQVDMMRNQNIIKITTMGNAYAKWVANPTMADEYKDIVSESQTGINFLSLLHIAAILQNNS